MEAISESATGLAEGDRVVINIADEREHLRREVGFDNGTCQAMKKILTKQIAGVIQFIMVLLEIDEGSLVLALKAAEGRQDGHEALSLKTLLEAVQVPLV